MATDPPPSPVDDSSVEHAGDDLDTLTDHRDQRRRCFWCGTDPQYVAYHDNEWGQPVHDGRALFEKLSLEGFQAGLSWLTILRRREAFRDAFGDFSPATVAGFTAADVERLTNDAGIIRHRGKIEAVIANARIVLDLGGEDALAQLVWDHQPPPRPRPGQRREVATQTPQSQELSRQLRKLGWRFIGPTSAYAFMQSVGMVDDHFEGCHVPRHTG